MAKKIKWGTTTVPHHKLYISKLTSAEFYALDLIARKQVYSIKRGGNGYFDTNQAKIAQVLFLSKGTVSDLFKKMKERKLLEESEHGFRVVDSFIEFFYVMKNDELQVDDEVNYTHTLEGLVALNREKKSSEIEPPEEGEKFGNRTKSSEIEHLHHNSINNKTDVRQKAEDKSVFENENEAPQVNANPGEKDDVRELSIVSESSETLNQADYYHALKKYLNKYLPKYTKNEKEMDKGIAAAFKHGLKFSATPGSKKGVDSFFARNRVFFETEQENSPDHSEVDKIVNDFLDECMDDHKSDHSTYREFIGKVAWNRDVRALDFEALKRLYLDNKWPEVTFVREVYKRWRPKMYIQMGIEWSKFAATRKATMEVAMEGYNYYKSWVIPGWPKQ